MPKKNSQQEHAEAAAKALSDLNMVGAFIALAESSLFSPDCYPFEQKIVMVAQIESQKCLRRYDAAMARLALAQP